MQNKPSTKMKTWRQQVLRPGLRWHKPGIQVDIVLVNGCREGAVKRLFKKVYRDTIAIAQEELR